MDGLRDQKFLYMEVHASEKGLIELIRSIRSGDIESIKIQDGLPVLYRIALEKELFME